ncbi:uncharacterized protein LOC132314078 [Cornus florida]|uniref:uncharacterized protein LOC132314078 n=1 Tax=Cornus florida TaxID=4283 RepID=UPI00289F065F|nr:uncharacterized protein LOC132314078 [Cornus florida]
MKDYFGENCTYLLEYFHRQFRMRRELFLRILNDVKAYDDYFIQKRNATGRLGLFSIQKMTTAIRILTYGCAGDHCDKYIKIDKSTAIETRMTFCKAVIGVYREEYMRPPNEANIARLLQEREERGLPGMLGFVDCMHWEWKNCPVAWRGTHEERFHMPTLILEAIASKDLWIWHALFGMPATLMQTIPHPITVKEKLSTQKQEACRKDVERAFGVLQSKWTITQGPVHFWDKGDLCLIMKTYIILHNIIIEDVRHVNVGR